MTTAARTILTDETLRADAAHLVCCIPEGSDSCAPRRADLYPQLAEDALNAIDSYGCVPGDEELVDLVRRARYRLRLRRSAVRDRRPNVERRIEDANHAMYMLGRELFWRVRQTFGEGCCCSLHGRAA